MTDHLRRPEEDVLPVEVQRNLDAAIRTLESNVRVTLAGDVAKDLSGCTGVRGVCVHEVGHAVMGLLEGRLLTIIKFRITEARALRGTVFFAEPDLAAPYQKDSVAVAGLMRVIELVPSEGKSGSTLDEHRAEVESALRTHWGLVLRVADVLEEQFYMIRPQFCDIVREIDPALLEGLPHSTMKFEMPDDLENESGCLL